MLVKEINKEKMLEYMNKMDDIIENDPKSLITLLQVVETEIESVSHPTEYGMAFLGIRDMVLASVARHDSSAEDFTILSAGTAQLTMNVISLAYVAEIKKKATEN